MTGDVSGADLREVRDARTGQLGGVTLEITPVGRQRVAREATLDTQMVEIGVDRGIETQRSTSVSGIARMPCASATGP